VAEEGVETLGPAGAVLGERLAKAGSVAQLLDLRRWKPRLRQHLLGKEKRKPAGIETIGLRLPDTATECTGAGGISQVEVETERR
jgi:hypothetical protein